MCKLTDIDEKLLQELKIKAILLDIDNTLSPHKAQEPFADVPAWLEKIKKLNIKMLILSNRSNVQNVDDFAKKLNLEYVANAKKPFQWGFKKAIGILNFPRENILLAGDQIFTDILGANIAGIKSVLVEPQDNKNESLFIKAKRFFEAPFRASIRYNEKREN